MCTFLLQNGALCDWCGDINLMWVNIGSGNDLLPNGTKPLPEPMLTYHQWIPVTITSGQFRGRWFQSSINKQNWLEIYLSKFSFKSHWGHWASRSRNLSGINTIWRKFKSRSMSNVLIQPTCIYNIYNISQVHSTATRASTQNGVQIQRLYCVNQRWWIIISRTQWKSNFCSEI